VANGTRTIFGGTGRRGKNKGKEQAPEGGPATEGWKQKSENQKNSRKGKTETVNEVVVKKKITGGTGTQLNGLVVIKD